ncbi:MAG: cysteine desulfurase [Lactobacillales bacterium]|jgi:cysteine desulfurase|nr:cysteine desulfurase [Lactobacillales bacterium]
MNEKIYLDHAATTPIRPEVIDVMTDVMKHNFGNPSSIHSFGRKAHKQLTEMRKIIANSLSVKEHEIIFNSGGTESDNTAIISTALFRKDLGKHIITTAIEHHAVLHSMEYLEKNFGFEVTYLPVDEHGNLNIEDFNKSLREDTILVSIMYGNNEIGNLMPIKEIGELLENHPAYFHTDAVQAYGLVDIRPHELGIDLLSVSAHKLNGPKGVGFLYKNDAILLPEFMHGGEQEEKRRAGTENLIGITGMGKAVELLTDDEKHARAAHYANYQAIILDSLEKAEIEYHINGDVKNKLPHVLNLYLPGVNSDLLLMSMDLKGIALSTGSACTAGTVDPSHVLIALYGENHPAIKESIRISFGYGNTEEAITTFTGELVTAIQRLKK